MKSEKLNPITNLISFFTPEGEQWVIPIFYLQLILLAEVLAVLRDQGVGFLMHSFTLIILLVHGGLERRMQNRRFLITLSLAPLIRTINLFLSEPLIGRDLIYWWAGIGLVMFVAAFVAMVLLELPAKRVGISLNKLPQQFLIGITGIGFGTIEYLILRPEPLVPEFTFQAILIPALVLLVFTGFLEELIFRGLLQATSIVNMGKFGLTYVALIFGVLHVGYNSMLDVLFVFTAGWIFGYWVLKTESIIGVSIAHGLNNIVLFLILPFLLGTPTGQMDINPEDISPLDSATATSTLEGDSFPYLTFSPTPTIDLSIIKSEETFTLSPSPTFTELEPTFTMTLISTTAIPPLTQSTDCTPPVGWVTYTVKHGDTLFSISKAYGISVSELQSANCLTGTLIITGQTLYVPNVPPITSPVVDTPTNTPKPSTNTPLPTSPPATPTNTPLPTSTPTNTPLPTSTFTPTPP